MIIFIALCVAENTLVTGKENITTFVFLLAFDNFHATGIMRLKEKMASRLMQPDVCVAAFSNSTVYNYNSFLGLPVAREAVASFLQTFFAPNTVMKAENIVIGSGAGGLLNHMFFALAETNEGE